MYWWAFGTRVEPVDEGNAETIALRLRTRSEESENLTPQIILGRYPGQPVGDLSDRGLDQSVLDRTYLPTTAVGIGYPRKGEEYTIQLSAYDFTVNFGSSTQPGFFEGTYLMLEEL